MWRWTRDPGSFPSYVLHALVLATLLVYTYFAGAQWATMQRSLEASARAWVVLQDVPELPAPAPGEPLRFPVRFVNAGRSPAYDVRIAAHAAVAAPDADPPDCRRAPEGEVRSVIGPGQSRAVVVETSVAWEQLLKSLEAGTYVLRACGALDYQDGFRTTRVTRFCLKWDPATRRFDFCPRYNEVF